MRSLSRVIGVVVLLAALVTGCSSSKSNSVSPDSGVPNVVGTVTVVTASGSDDEIRQKVVDQVITLGSNAGHSFDVGCVSGVVAQLNSGDLQAFRANFTTPALSANGLALSNKIMSCDRSPTATSRQTRHVRTDPADAHKAAMEPFELRAN